MTSRRKTSNQPRKKPKQDRSRDTYEAIVEATARILEQQGLEGLTTNRVARVAGISVGSLYQYFPGKEALVEEVRRRFSAKLQARLLAMLGRMASLPLREALRDWVHTLVAIHAESPGVHHAVGRGTPHEARAAGLRVVEGFLEARADELRPSNVRLAACILSDGAELLIHHTALREPERLQDPDWVEAVCELLERYALAEPPPANPGSAT